MLTSKELVANAIAYLQKSTCYLKGFWCQYMSTAEYNRVLKMYPDNAKYNNQRYCNTDVYAADCICFLKNLIAGGTVNRRLSYQQMAAGPLGDCNNQTFYNSLYDLCSPVGAPAGYGLATTGHAALCIGNDQWIDFNFTNGGQNGLKLHTGFSGTNFRCGKIPGIDYNQPAPAPSTGSAEEFRDYLIKNAETIITSAYNKWKGGN